MDEQIKNRNEYEGNGWSKYQMLVMTQLEAHTELFEKVLASQELLRTESAVSRQNVKNWQDNTDIKISSLQRDMTYVLSDEKGINARLKTIEENAKIVEKSKIRFNAAWGFIGGGIVVLIDIGLKALEFFVHKP